MMGPIGNAGTTPTPPKVNLAPIARSAEAELEEDSTGAVRVAVNPATRVIGSANVHIPLAAADASPAEPPAAKARTVLDQYSEIFGLDSEPGELGHSEVATDNLGMTHVYFDQMADGVPVFGGRVGVHFTPGGSYVASMNASVVPDFSVGAEKLQLTSQEAIARAALALHRRGESARTPGLRLGRTAHHRRRCAPRLVRLAGRR